VISIPLGRQILTGAIGDIVSSEAGLATLMDRKVNTGTVDPLPAVLAEVAGQNELDSFADLQRFERDVIAAMRYRKDYLAEAALGQPGPSVHPERRYLPSRHRPRGKGRGR
jgi:hypothetical protein